VGKADREGQDKDDSLVHESFEVNEYLVKAKAWGSSYADGMGGVEGLVSV